MKSTVKEMPRRFDAGEELFSYLDTGQSATVDAPLAMALVAQVAASTPHSRQVLDVGCAAGNHTLKQLEQLPNIDVRLIDLSRALGIGSGSVGRLSTTRASSPSPLHPALHPVSPNVINRLSKRELRMAPE